jgi:hypothetical protein
MSGTSNSVTTTTTSTSQTVVTESGDPYHGVGQEIASRKHTDISASLLALTEALRLQAIAIEALTAQVAAVAHGEEALHNIRLRVEVLEQSAR